MNPKHLTGLFIGVVIVLIVAYDLFALHRFGEEATITSVLRDLANRWGMFPYLVAFGLGAVFGHVFLVSP